MIFGATAIFAKLSFAHGCGVLTLLAGRYLGSAIVTVPLAAWKAPRELRAFPNPRGLAIVTFFNLASAGFYMAALSFDQVGRIAPIVFVFPAAIAGLGWLHFRTPVTRRLAVALGVGITGTILVFGSDIGAPSKVAGGVLAVITMLSAAYYFITASRFTGGHWLANAAHIFSAGALVFVPAAAIFGSHLPHGIGWLWLTLLGLACEAGYLIQLSVFPLVGSQRAGVIAMFEPVVAVVLAYLVLNETMSGLQAVGAAFVLVAFVVATVPFARRRAGAAAGAGPGAAT